MRSLHHPLWMTLVVAAGMIAAPAEAQMVRRDSTLLTAQRTLQAAPAESPVRVDGELGDAVWQRAAVADAFVQRQPNSGAPATERTEVRVVYDREAVYVAMRLYDSRPDSIVARLGRRDESVFSDWAYVMIDSYDDNRTGFGFVVNPRGVKRDYIIYNDKQEDVSWDAVWDAATRTDSLGWTAELRIPFSQLRFRGTPGEQSWGINFQRRIARRDEWSFWSPTPPSAPGVVSSFGQLRGMRDLHPPRRLELQPYVVGRASRAPAQAGNPFYRATDPYASAGMDLKYGLSSDLTLTATLNPDFGQVEADPSQVNLTAFETFLPEKRPFFVEGSDIFNFTIGLGSGEFGNEQLFYSRRVGRTPQRNPLTLGATYYDSPEATRILGAAKLSGKTSSGWSVGVLDAVTGDEEARYLGPDGEATAAMEPLTNYAIVRAFRDLREGQSAIGGIFTSTHRDIDEGSGLDFLRSSAYTGGFDARHRFGGGNYEVSGWALGSLVHGSERALLTTQRSAAHYFQRPDAGHLELDSAATSMAGTAASVQVAKIGGGNWIWGASGQMRTPGFEINDLGYQRNADFVLQSGYVGYLSHRPGKVFRRWNLVAAQSTQWTFGGERTSLGANVTGAFSLRNYWGGSGGIIRQQEALTPEALRGGPALLTPGYTNAFFAFNTDQRRRVIGKLSGSVTLEDETDGYSLSLSPTLLVRPSAGIELSVQPTFVRTLTDWQFVPSESLDGSRHYVFGRLSQTTAALTARLGYAISPNLSLQLYAQPFVSAGDFTAMKEVSAPRASAFAARFRPLPAAGTSHDPATELFSVDTDADGSANLVYQNPEFNFRQLRSNLVLRWEYRPGSTLFLVWGQGRTDAVLDGTFRLGSDAGDLFRTPGTNVLLLKMSYWFGL